MGGAQVRDSDKPHPLLVSQATPFNLRARRLKGVACETNPLLSAGREKFMLDYYPGYWLAGPRESFVQATRRKLLTFLACTFFTS